MDADEHLRRGLSHRVVDTTGIIRHSEWCRSAGASEIVGQCRQCDGHMVAEPPEQVGRITFYEARCLNDERHRVAAPGGRTLLRSSRASEQPDEMANRRQLWADLRKREAAA